MTLNGYKFEFSPKFALSNLITHYKNSNITVSTGVSRIAKMSVVFVEPGVSITNEKAFGQVLRDPDFKRQ